MTEIEEYLEPYLKNMYAEEWEIFNCVKNICSAYDKKRNEMAEEIYESIVQYKSEDYRAVGKLLDRIVNLANLTTAPSDARKLNLESVAYKQDMGPLFQDLKNKVSDILSGYEKRIRDCNIRIADLVSELNETKQKLSEFENERESLDGSLISDVQRLLARLEIKDLSDENHPISLMLEDLELEFTWDYAENPRLFNKLIITDPVLSGVRLPAMIRKEKLVRQGLVNMTEQNNEKTAADNDTCNRNE